MHELKFRARAALAVPLGRLMGEIASTDPFLRRSDIVVPVPLHPRRRRLRGFNQSELLAGPVAEALGRPLRTDLLRRVVDTPAQSSLGLPARRRNVAGAFVARDMADAPRVLLVDDVLTTGSTVSACSRALRSAGAAGVAAVVFGLAVEREEEE